MNRKIRTWVEISLNDLEHNYREISSRLPDGCQMLGVCKANAYGHGAVRVAQRLQRAGCQWVAVNCYDEAEELRAAGVPKENIWFIIALGTHGVMYRTEFVRKLGEEIVENYEVHNHNLFFNHVFVGNTTNNVPVEINADVMSADYKIAIGTTMALSLIHISEPTRPY